MKINSIRTTTIILFFISFVFDPMHAKQISGQSTTKPVKNVIFFIGDGMGPQQMGFAMLYARKAPNSVVKGRKLHIKMLMEMGETGIVLVEPHGGLVVDSACSATQFAIGEVSRPEMIGLNAKGDPIPTVLERAKQSGRSTGLVSDTRITHATPASYAAHRAHRSMENEIAVDMLQTAPDVMLSGGFRHWIPKSANDPKTETYKTLQKLIPSHLKISSKRKDEKNLLHEAKDLGYNVVFEKQTMTASKNGKLLGLFTSSGMPNGIVHSRTKNDPNRKIPSLKEMTTKALEILSRNSKGFFLMIEAGQIDWAAHRNDAGTMLHEMLKLDEALGAVLNWAKEREDTLVILTADHETGSFGLSYSSYKIPKPQSLPGKAFQARLFKSNFNYGNYEVLDKIYRQKKSFPSIMAAFDTLPKGQQNAQNLHRIINENLEFKVTLQEAKRILQTEQNIYHRPGHYYLSEQMIPKISDFRAFYPYGSLDRSPLIGRAIAKKQQTVWGTATHTSTPVLVVAWGPKRWTKKFDGCHHSTEIGKLTLESLGFH